MTRRTAVAAMLALLLLVPPAAAAWTSFHGDPRNTGAQAGTAYQGFGEVWWQQEVNATRIEATPVVDGGILVVADWSGTVRGLAASTGKELWTSKMPAKVVGTPAIAGSRVFVVDTAGNLKALDLRRGTELAKATVGPSLASPTVHEGKLFIGNEAGDMLAFETHTLTLLWRFAVSSVAQNLVTTTSGNPPVSTQRCGPPIPTGQVRGAPAVYEGLVVFGSLNHWIYAVSEQGEPGTTTLVQWVYETQDAVFGSPAIDHATGRVLVGSYDERVYALPAKPAGMGPVFADNRPCGAFRNTPSWQFVVPSTIGNSKVHTTPAVQDGTAYVGANNGRVYAIATQNGQQRWSATTGAAVMGSPAVSNGFVVVGSDDGDLHFLKAADGTHQARLPMGSPVKANPAIDGANTYAASFDGRLVLVGPGRPKFADLETTASYEPEAREVRAVVRNAGQAASGPTNASLAVWGVESLRLPVPRLQPGDTVDLRFPVALDNGTHTLRLTVDPDNAVAESDEDDNAVEMQATVGRPPPPPPPPGTATPTGSDRPRNDLPPAGFALALAVLAALAAAIRRRRA